MTTTIEALTDHVDAEGNPITAEEWQSMLCLGSSDAAAICGLSPWKTPYAVWAEKMGISPPIDDNERMRFGRRLEPIIADEFAFQTGLIVERCQVLMRNRFHPYMTCTPDYTVVDADGQRGILEIKNTHQFAQGDWEEGMPDTVHCQVMHQLACCDLKYAIACVLIGGNKIKWHRLERDEGIIANLVEIEREFWQRVQDRMPPPFESEDSALLNVIYRKSNGVEVDLPPESAHAVALYLSAREEKAYAEEQMELAAAELKGMLANAEKGKCGDAVVSWKNVQRKGYTVQPTEYRQFSIKTPKAK